MSPNYFLLLYLIPPVKSGNQLLNGEHLNPVLESGWGWKEILEYVSHTDLSTITIYWMLSNPAIRLWIFLCVCVQISMGT